MGLCDTADSRIYGAALCAGRSRRLRRGDLVCPSATPPASRTYAGVASLPDRDRRLRAVLAVVDGRDAGALDAGAAGQQASLPLHGASSHLLHRRAGGAAAVPRPGSKPAGSAASGIIAMAPRTGNRRRAGRGDAARAANRPGRKLDPRAELLRWMEQRAGLTRPA